MNYNEQRVSNDLILKFSEILEKTKVKLKFKSKYDLNQLMNLLHDDIPWNYLNKDEILFILFTLKMIKKKKVFNNNRRFRKVFRVIRKDNTDKYNKVKVVNSLIWL